MHDEPSEKNQWCLEHALLILRSYKRLTGRSLITDRASDEDFARMLYHLPAVVLSHDTREDPIFNYANLAAQRRFEMTWDELTVMPSRQSAEPMLQEERDRLIRTVRKQGYMDDYNGVRVSASGQRFFIPAAIVWNLVDASGNYCGQAATFSQWKDL